MRLLEFKRKRPLTKVINLSRNFGAVAASKTGFQYVTGDGFLILSADLQEPIEQVIAMVDEWLAGEKFVVSARAERGDPLVTRIFAWIYYRLLELLVVKGYPQGGFDLMLMDSVMLPYMRSSTKSTNPNLYAFWLGFKPRVLYYERRHRKYGRSRWTLSKKLRFLADTVSGFSVMPIRALSGFGAVIALLSFVYGISTLIAAFLDNVPVRGFATLAVLISFFSGLILIMLGALGDTSGASSTRLTISPKVLWTKPSYDLRPNSISCRALYFRISAQMGRFRPVQQEWHLPGDAGFYGLPQQPFR